MPKRENLIMTKDKEIMKLCIECEEIKPLTDFYISNKQARRKACIRVKNKGRYHAHKQEYYHYVKKEKPVKAATNDKVKRARGRPNKCGVTVTDDK